MDKFKFNLQKVLDYRIKLEDEKKEEFIESQRDLMLQRNLLDDMSNMKIEMQSRKFNFKFSFDFQNHARYIELLQNRIDEQKSIVLTAKDRFETKKFELIKCTSDRKVIEKLKEKAKEEFEFEQSQIEQKQNDDFALFAFVRSERR